MWTIEYLYKLIDINKGTIQTENIRGRKLIRYSVTLKLRDKFILNIT